MSKNIQTSGRFFERLANPLRLRQPSGEMGKREAQSVTLAALHLSPKTGKRRGFETVYDTILTFDKTLWCQVCGSRNEAESEDCYLCGLNFFTEESKFTLVCCGLLPAKNCGRPFYIERKKADGKVLLVTEFNAVKSLTGDLIDDGEIAKLTREEFNTTRADDICDCWAKERKAHSETRKMFNLRRKTRAAIVTKQADNLLKAKVELAAILATDTSGFSRDQKRELSRRKVQLMKIVSNIS